MVECNLAKVDVAGSNPVSRSNPPPTRGQSLVGGRWTARPGVAGVWAWGRERMKGTHLVEPLNAWERARRSYAGACDREATSERRVARQQGSWIRHGQGSVTMRMAREIGMGGLPPPHPQTSMIGTSIDRLWARDYTDSPVGDVAKW